MKKILLIDDDKEMCEEVEEILTEEGYEVEKACDAGRVQRLIDKADYHLMLLDLKLPGLNGLDLLKKSKAKNPEAKVFIVSGRPFIKELLKEEKSENLADEIINKPFSIEYLMGKIEELMG